MITILLHTSKTMRTETEGGKAPVQAPLLNDEARLLRNYMRTLSTEAIQTMMKVSTPLATKTKELYAEPETSGLAAIDSFLGNIYSGLQAQSFTREDREYANQHLYILSGMYGVLRALDTISPYRLEMGYTLPTNPRNSAAVKPATMYAFWGDAIAQHLPAHLPIINLSAVEYTKAVFPHVASIEGLKDVSIITPKFLTVSPKTGQPTFVTVHAKIARGAFAGWLIRSRVKDVTTLTSFCELGYKYNEVLSTPTEPVFVAQTFQGLGLSVRLT